MTDYSPEGVRAWMDSYAAPAYNAYGDSAQWKTFDGRPMPAWRDLPPETQSHWRMAALSVLAVRALNSDVEG